MTIVSSKISEKRKDHVDHSKRFDYNIGSVPRRFIGTPDGNTRKGSWRSQLRCSADRTCSTWSWIIKVWRYKSRSSDSLGEIRKSAYFVAGAFWYSRRESNPQRPLRRGLLYPFNYGSKKLFSSIITILYVWDNVNLLRQVDINRGRLYSTYRMVFIGKCKKSENLRENDRQSPIIMIIL